VAVETDNVCEPIIADDAKQHLKTAALRAYSTHQKQLLDDERVVEFLPMVRKIAQRAVSYLRPPLSFEDLISAGTIGLIKAARDFDPSHQVEFKTYAYTRRRSKAHAPSTFCPLTASERKILHWGRCWPRETPAGRTSNWKEPSLSTGSPRL